MYENNDSGIHMTRITASIVLCLFCLFAFHPNNAEAKKRKEAQPCWVTQPCDPYNESDFLIGVGSGSTIEEADAAALGALSRQFVVTISQRQTSLKDTAQTSRGAEEISKSSHQRLQSKTDVTSQTTLEHVEVVRHWSRTSTKKQPEVIYSLATINRANWLTEIDLERNELSVQMSKLRRDMNETGSLYEQIDQYKALRSLGERDVALYDTRQIVDYEQRSMPPSLSPDNVTLEFDQERKKLAIFVPSNTPHRQKIQQALAPLGLPIVGEPTSHSEIRVQCTENQTVSPPDAYQFINVQTNLSCSIYNLDTLLKQETFTGTAASRSADKSVQQSEQALGKELSLLSKTVDTLWSL